MTDEREREIEAGHKERLAIPSSVCHCCQQVWPCDASYLLAQLREARGKLEAVERIAARLRSASRVFHSEQGHAGPWPECKQLQCSQDRDALDALKGVE